MYPDKKYWATSSRIIEFFLSDKTIQVYLRYAENAIDMLLIIVYISFFPEKKH